MSRVVVALAVVLAGCSLVARPHRRADGTCQSSWVPPAVDVAGALVWTGLAIHAAREADPYGHNYDPSGLYVIPALAHAVAAAVGVAARRDCSRVRSAR